MTDKLGLLRKKIDVLDEKVMSLLVKRFELASEIGKTKRAEGTPVKDTDREDRVIKKIRKHACRPLTKDAAEMIYRTILRESRGIQSKKRKKS